MAIMAAATIYRITIEKKQAEMVAKNLEYKHRIETFKIMLDAERDEIMMMTPQEIYDMLEKVWGEHNHADNS
jgi:hypothetical protein